MVINHNLKSQYITRQNKLLNYTSDKIYETLGSAKKINWAGDDASGLAVSEKFRSQIRGLHMAGKNAQDDISFVQTADGYLEDMTASLQRLRELAVAAANGTFTNDDRELTDVEVGQMVKAVQKIADYAEFNKLKIFNGETWNFHLGANMDQNEQLFIEKMNTKDLGIENLSVNTMDKANSAIGTLDEALKKVLSLRAKLGAVSNRLEKTYGGLMINHENSMATESMIRDTNMADSMTNYLSTNVLRDFNSRQVYKMHELNTSMIQTILKF